MAVPMVIDTDGGIDDASALWWALTSPEVELVGVTTVHGNIDAVTAAANVCRILEAAGRPDIPVAVGADEPFAEAPEMRPADFIHCTDGIGEANRPPAAHGPVDESADELLARLVAEAPEPITLVTIGPLTNVAHRVAADPAWAGAVDRLVVMGGSVSMPGNAKPGAEANIAHDPAAAAVVAHAGWARPPLMVGLDVTHVGTFTDYEFALVDERRNAAADYMAEPLAFYRRYGGTFCEPGECPQHDLLAVMAAVVPGLVHGPVLPIAVQDTPGPAWGVVVVDRRVPFFERAGSGSAQPVTDGFSPWELGLEVDVDRFRAEVRRLFGG
jgi:purine nucleosidase